MVVAQEDALALKVVAQEDALEVVVLEVHDPVLVFDSLFQRIIFHRLDSLIVNSKLIVDSDVCLYLY